MKSKRLLLAALLAASVLVPARAAETAADVIERAREFLGGEKVLKRVTSLHFTGTIEIKLDGAGAPAGAKPVMNDIDFVFQRPLQYRMTRSDARGGRETTGLNGYDGWTMVEIPDRPKVVRMLDPDRIWALQASAFDSLNFFGGIETRRGTVSLKGDTTVDGKPAVQLMFAHPGKIDMLRTFDKKTGRLLTTVFTDGQTFREEGEQTVEGIRFPQRVVSTLKKTDAAGKEVVVTTIISISGIKINETFEASKFDIPREH